MHVTDTNTLTNLTDLLARWQAGESDAEDLALPLVYEELRRIARRLFRSERKDHTLGATAVVHEAYLKLAKESGLQWQDRHEFYGFCAHLMRRLLVEHSRRRAADKRGGGATRVFLEEATLIDPVRPPDFQALDAALRILDDNDQRKAQIVMLRVFSGLSIAETARCLGTSPRTVNREWRKALAWLHYQLDSAHPNSSPDEQCKT